MQRFHTPRSLIRIQQELPYMAKAFNKLRNPRLELDDVVPFGRYAGYSVLKILKDRPTYISWLIFNTDIKFYPSVHSELYKYLAKHDKPTRTRFVGYDHDTLSDWCDPFDDIPF